MVKQEVSSDMMVPKWRVLTPLLEVRVLEWDEKREIKRSSDREKKKDALSMHGIANPRHGVSGTLYGLDMAR